MAAPNNRRFIVIFIPLIRNTQQKAETCRFSSTIVLAHRFEVERSCAEYEQDSSIALSEERFGPWRRFGKDDRALSLLPAIRQDSRFGDAVEEVFAAEIELTICDGGGRAEGVFQVVECQNCVVVVMMQDHRVSVPCCDVDAAIGADGRRENEIVNALKAKRFAARLSSHRVQPGKDVLIVPQKIECVVVQKR